MTIANTILEQLGGGRFLAMTGVKHLVTLRNGILMTLPHGAKVTGLSIILEGDDTYTLQGYRGRGDKNHPCGEPVSGIHCDDLQCIFTEMTGFYTHL